MEKIIIGQSNDVQQMYDDTCAIKSQQIILNDFGIPVTEDQLVQFSYEHGWYNGDGVSGTLPQYVGELISEAGIPCTQQVDANVFDLTNELVQGHKIIVGVDSGELWDDGIKEWWEDIRGESQADHALIVAGIDNTDPNNPQVLLTDPGTGETCKSYPLDQFMDAWQDSGCFMVSTDIAPATFIDTQLVNNQPTMYLPEVAGNSYQDFQLFHDMSNALPPMSAWDFSNGAYPIDSMMDAYHDYAQNDVDFNTLFQNQYAFIDFMDFDNFNNNYLDTLHGNIENLAIDHSNTYNDYTDYLNGVDTDNFNVNNFDTFLSDQYNHYIEMGDYNTANFFEQQSNYLDMCEALDIDPSAFSGLF